MAKRRSTRNKHAELLKETKNENRTFSVSHSVIIDGVCNQSLLDPSIQSILPPKLKNIYDRIINDLSLINDIQSKKDRNFYHCNMTFWKGEERVCGKRKAIVEMLKKNADDAELKRVTNEAEEMEKVTDKKNGMKRKKESLVDQITENRPKRKRKIPSKFEELVIETDIKSNEVQTIEEDPQIIDLSSDDSPTPKTKVYFREPAQRKILAANGKKVKEHTLLDKIMLGINCIRQWTEKGLQLTRIPENELGLLNKRLSSIRCTMSDLTEHTDENNNKSLSVLIQSELFTNLLPTAGASSLTSNDMQPNVSEVETSASKQQAPLSTIPRPKSKQHVSSVYRQRHNVPSILSRPPPPMATQKRDDEAKSASQLLRLKSQKGSYNSQRLIAPAGPIEQPKNYVKTSEILNTPSHNCHTNSRPTLFYQSVPRNNFVLPIYISPLVPIGPQRAFRIPLNVPPSATNSIRSSNVTKFQPIQMKPAYEPSPSEGKLPIPSMYQPPILKNLLQQSSHNAIQNGHRNFHASRMVPLSVFQNNLNKWPAGQLFQYTAKK